MKTPHLHTHLQAKPATVEQALAYLADLQDSLQKQFNTQRSKISNQKKADELGITLAQLHAQRSKISKQKKADELGITLTEFNTQRSKISKQKKADELGITPTELQAQRSKVSKQKKYPMFSPDFAYIYMLVINGYTYIGCSKDFATRFANHSSQLRYGTNPNKAFQQAYNDYIAEHQLEVIILAELPLIISREDLETIELSFIAIESAKNPLNTNTIGA